MARPVPAIETPVPVPPLLASGEFSASLSDGSAPTYTDSSLDNPSGVSVAEYTLSYQAGAAGQTLSIRYTLQTDHGLGIVSLLGATLQ